MSEAQNPVCHGRTLCLLSGLTTKLEGKYLHIITPTHPLCVYAHAHACVCVCVCVCMREREREVGINPRQQKREEGGRRGGGDTERV